MGSLLLISQTALELGFQYALVAMALFLSYRVLDIADLTTDGGFVLGAAVSVTVTAAGHPVLAIPAAMLAGACAGFVTAFLQTKLGVESILAGIIVNTGLYTVNLAVMGWSSNLSIFGTDTLLSLAKGLSGEKLWTDWSTLIVLGVLLAAVSLLVGRFLRTRLGLSIRATGDNADMVRASSINPAFTITVGLCLANSLTGLAGCLTGLVNKSCDINLGTGMVTVALASLIIGETMFGRFSMGWRIFGVIVGSCIYRIIIAVALAANVPTECFKLVSALIVAVAIAMPQGRKLLAIQRQKLARRREGTPC